MISSAPRRAPVFLAYAAFVLVGISAAVGGVALPAQMADYGVNRTTIGISFFTFSAGFLIAGFTNGHVIHRFGLRLTLLLSSGLFATVAALTALRPPFVVLLLLGLPGGMAAGLLESALNTQLAAMPRASALLNRLHAFFGVGALLGPVLAARLLLHFSWTSIWVVLTLASVPLVAGFALVRGDGVTRVPASLGDLPSVAEGVPVPEEVRGAAGAGPTSGMLRETVAAPVVLLAAAMLVAYVGLEIGVGTWAYSALVEDRGIDAVLAGLLVSGYWLGLTLGRLLIEPFARLVGWSDERVVDLCVVGVIAALAVVWALPVTPVAALGLGIAGFFLGPIFPGIMVATPRMTQAAQVATAIGVLNGVSVLGGSLLPWLAGFLTERIGLWTLWPYAIVLGLVQFGLWRALTPRLAPADPDAPGHHRRNGPPEPA